MAFEAYSTTPPSGALEQPAFSGWHDPAIVANSPAFAPAETLAVQMSGTVTDTDKGLFSSKYAKSWYIAGGIVLAVFLYNVFHVNTYQQQAGYLASLTMPNYMDRQAYTGHGAQFTSSAQPTAINLSYSGVSEARAVADVDAALSSQGLNVARKDVVMSSVYLPCDKSKSCGSTTTVSANQYSYATKSPLSFCKGINVDSVPDDSKATVQSGIIAISCSNQTP